MADNFTSFVNESVSRSYQAFEKSGTMASENFSDDAVQAISGTSVDEYDDFNSFLETVLSDNEPAETLPGERTTGAEKSGALLVPLENGKQATLGDVAGVSLTAADMESASVTGVVECATPLFSPY